MLSQVLIWWSMSVTCAVFRHFDKLSAPLARLILVLYFDYLSQTLVHPLSTAQLSNRRQSWVRIIPIPRRRLAKLFIKKLIFFNIVGNIGQPTLNDIFLKKYRDKRSQSFKFCFNVTFRGSLSVSRNDHIIVSSAGRRELVGRPYPLHLLPVVER